MMPIWYQVIKVYIRFMEIRVVIHESFKMIALSILFRFFFIVHAEKGLLVRASLHYAAIQLKSERGKIVKSKRLDFTHFLTKYYF